MNVARAKKLSDGSYDLLARELQLYLDPKTNEILHAWYNPFIAQNVSGKECPPPRSTRSNRLVLFRSNPRSEQPSLSEHPLRRVL